VFLLEAIFFKFWEIVALNRKALHINSVSAHKFEKLAHKFAKLLSIKVKI